MRQGDWAFLVSLLGRAQRMSKPHVKPHWTDQLYAYGSLRQTCALLKRQVRCTGDVRKRFGADFTPCCGGTPWLKPRSLRWVTGQKDLIDLHRSCSCRSPMRSWAAKCEAHPAKKALSSLCPACLHPSGPCWPRCLLMQLLLCKW